MNPEYVTRYLAPHNQTPVSHMLWALGLEEIPDTDHNFETILSSGFIFNINDSMEVVKGANGL